MKTVLFHYFSGTGNTLHVVKLMASRLEELGYQTQYLNIEEHPIENIPAYDLHIFAFPVYGFGIPAIVHKYMKSLSMCNRKACLISVGGHSGKTEGFEGDALIHGSKHLVEKGFDVFLTDLVSYPENWTQILNPPSEEIQDRIFIEQDKMVLDIIDKVVRHEKSIRPINLSRLILCKIVFFLYTNFGRRLLGKLFIADNKCNACGKCTKVCPVNNINLIKTQLYWHWHCEGCQRCINICPKQAIQTSTIRLIAFLLMEILPIFLVIEFNRIIPLNFILDLLLYFTITVTFTISADFALKLLEFHPKVQRLLRLNFTHKFRRYFIKH